MDCVSLASNRAEVRAQQKQRIVFLPVTFSVILLLARWIMIMTIFVPLWTKNVSTVIVFGRRSVLTATGCVESDCPTLSNHFFSSIHLMKPSSCDDCLLLCRFFSYYWYFMFYCWCVCSNTATNLLRISCSCKERMRTTVSDVLLTFDAIQCVNIWINSASNKKIMVHWNIYLRNRMGYLILKPLRL